MRRLPQILHEERDLIVEKLVDKLYEKGVIDEQEYKEMKDEAHAEKQAAEEAKAKSNDPGSMTALFSDKFNWSSADGKNSISIGGRVQLDYRSYDNPTPADGFDIRRAYLGVSGTLNQDWSYALIGNFDTSGSNSQLEYGFLDYKWNDAAQLRMGAFKYLYSYEEITSSRFTDFQERSFVNSWVPGKDVGLMFYGEPKKNVYSYAIGVANGEGKNSNETNAAEDGKDVIARGAVNFAPLVKWENVVAHLGVGYSNGAIAQASPGSQTTEARGLTFFKATAPTGTSMDRTRTGLEGVVAYGPFKLQAETNTVNYNDGAGYDHDIDTYYVAANWTITGESYVKAYTINGLRRIKPKKPVGSGGWGAWDLGIRYSNFDGGGYANTATSTNKANAVTIGLKWIPTNMTRFILNYVDTDFSTPITSGTESVSGEKAITLRAQLDF